LIRGASRRPALPAVIVLVLAVAGCSSPGITPLYSIRIDPTPTPTLSPGNAARAAFSAMVLAGDMTYHADFTGSWHGAGNIVEMRGSLDVAGLDYQTTATYAFPDGSATYSIKYVGGSAWVRRDKGAWKHHTAFDPARNNSPFAFLTSEEDVDFVKSETIGGRDLHRVQFDDSLIITPEQVPAGNVTQERIRTSWLEVTLASDGIPITAHWRLEGRERVSGQLQEVIIQADLTFSKVGEAMTIAAP
jgi:hypothetical protein